MKRVVNASYVDPIDKSAELLEMLKDNLDCETILDDLISWMGSEEAAHALEDIAKDFDLLPDFSDAYDEFEEWYSGLSASDKYEVDAIASDIGIGNGYNRYANLTQEQFYQILDIFEMRKRG